VQELELEREQEREREREQERELELEREQERERELEREQERDQVQERELERVTNKEDVMSRTIEVSDETYEKIKDQLSQEEIIDVESYQDLVGKQFFFRTVTYHMVGKVTKIIGDFLRLEQASWIADSGRFSQAVKTGSFSEIEPVGTCFVNLKSVTDFFPANYKLPTEQK